MSLESCLSMGTLNSASMEISMWSTSLPRTNANNVCTICSTRSTNSSSPAPGPINNRSSSRRPRTSTGTRALVSANPGRRRTSRHSAAPHSWDVRFTTASGLANVAPTVRSWRATNRLVCPETTASYALSTDARTASCCIPRAASPAAPPPPPSPSRAARTMVFCWEKKFPTRSEMYRMRRRVRSWPTWERILIAVLCRPEDRPPACTTSSARIRPGSSVRRRKTSTSCSKRVY
mmetsp:Transcript_28432/g.73539  ORF Transcript_28432/g.73539 Transcript_28432/m.73539 type:complete len:234 (-) Transcript_28432:318-1019(-)